MTVGVRAGLARQAEARGFEASSLEDTGRLLAALAASKPGGRILELGTGVGIGLTWLLDGASPDARIVTVELDDDLQQVAREAVGDPRVEFVTGDGGEWLERASAEGQRYDLVFADTWPGKYSHLEEALSLVAPGGIYLIDDLLPQPNWPDGHQTKVDGLVPRLQALSDEWAVVRLDWASGLMILTRRA